MGRYLHRVGDALSQLANVAFLGGRNPNESVSGRCWRQNEHWFFGKLRIAIDGFFRLFGQQAHCADAYRADLSRAAHTLSQEHALDRV